MLGPYAILSKGLLCSACARPAPRVAALAEFAVALFRALLFQWLDLDVDPESFALALGLSRRLGGR
jgi:hypothetical protein